ncbi:MAG: VOC family protein [Myxococcales bacterium]|nr:VOC family protein [Myxococcales bacterium]
MRLHLALNTAHFTDSVAFYRTLFGVDPVKHKPGYAKFSVADPAVNLTLNAVDAPRAAGRLNHLGVEVDSRAAVQAARDRLASAGVPQRSEREVDCCHALQDKVWISDPDGNAWEFFVVLTADTTPGLTAEGPAPAGARRTCCA